MNRSTRVCPSQRICTEDGMNKSTRVCPSQHIYTEEEYEQVSRSLPKSAHLHRARVRTSQQEVSPFTQKKSMNKSTRVCPSQHIYTEEKYEQVNRSLPKSAHLHRMNKSRRVCPSKCIYTEEEYEQVNKSLPKSAHLHRARL